MNDYQFCKDDWKIAARNIFLCVIGVVILTPLTLLFASFGLIEVALDAMGNFPSSNSFGSNNLAWITSVLLLGLLVWYIVSLTKFKNSQISDESSSAVGSIRTCVIIQLAGILISLLFIFVPVAGAVLTLIWCIALIIMQFVIKEAYRTLSEDDTWSKVARRGASQLKTSVAYTIYSLFAPFLWLILFLLSILLVAGSKDMNWMVIISDIVQGNFTAYLVPFFVLLICGLIQLYWGVMSFVLMILGWNNIQSGTLVDPDEKESTINTKQNYIAEQSVSADPAQTQNVETPSFCTECGEKLTPGAKFCPSCGKPLLIVSVSQTEVAKIDPVDTVVAQSDPVETEVAQSKPVETESECVIPSPAPVIQTAEDFDDSADDLEDDNSRKWWLYGGIAAGVLILGLLLWFFLSKNNTPDGPASYVFTPSATVYKTVEDWNGSDPVGELEYGDSVVTYEMDPTETWIKVAARKDGKRLNGYVDVTKLMDSESFNALRSRGGFEHENIRLAIFENYERKALAQKLNELGPDWKLHTINLGYGDVPMVKSSYIDGLTPKGVGFAFIAINNSSDEKHLYLYTYDDDTNPVLVYDENVNKKWDGISDIKIKKGKVKVKYYENDYEDADSNDDDNDIQQYVDDHTAVFRGMIDGKYPVTMTLMLSGEYISGSYYYDKYKTEIPLNGEFTFNEDGDKIVSLTETNDGVITGHFQGIWSLSSFSGYWISSDGERRMDFSLTL